MAKNTVQCQQVIREYKPNREGKVPGVALAGPGQETAMDTPRQQELLCLNSSDVGMEPPRKQLQNSSLLHSKCIMLQMNMVKSCVFHRGDEKVVCSVSDSGFLKIIIYIQQWWQV